MSPNLLANSTIWFKCVCSISPKNCKVSAIIHQTVNLKIKGESFFLIPYKQSNKIIECSLIIWSINYSITSWLTLQELVMSSLYSSCALLYFSTLALYVVSAKVKASWLLVNFCCIFSCSYGWWTLFKEWQNNRVGSDLRFLAKCQKPVGPVPRWEMRKLLRRVLHYTSVQAYSFNSDLTEAHLICLISSKSSFSETLFTLNQILVFLLVQLLTLVNVLKRRLDIVQCCCSLHYVCLFFQL